jgi:hypothetical protein
MCMDDDQNRATLEEEVPLVCYMSPREVMHIRWIRAMQQRLPDVDFEDLTLAQRANSFSELRQFAPEFSQCAYQSMLGTERIIGAYTTQRIRGLRPVKRNFKVTEKQREAMIILIQDLHKAKDYKD